MLSRNASRTTKPRRQNLRSRHMAIETVEDRRLMAADLVAMVDVAGPTADESVAAEVSNDAIDQASTARLAPSISNGFPHRGFALPDLRITDQSVGTTNLDVWEHAYVAAGDQGTPAQGELGDLGGPVTDAVDSVFADLEDSESSAMASTSKLPDSVVGVLRWENLMEYFQVLDQLAEIAEKYNFDFDLDGSIARARQDSNLQDTEALTRTETAEFLDRLSVELNNVEESSSTSDSESKFQDLINEAMQELRERAVVYWQRVDGPGHVVFDPYGVTTGNPR